MDLFQCVNSIKSVMFIWQLRGGPVYHTMQKISVPLLSSSKLKTISDLSSSNPETYNVLNLFGNMFWI